MRKLALVTSVLAGLASLACAQAELAGPDQFPQFRGVGGLTGNGFSVSPDGKPSKFGALSLSTPIGYTLGHQKLYVSGSVISPGSNLVGFRSGKGLNDGNGTATVMAGLNLPNDARFAYTFVVLSSLGDNVSNLQYQPGLQDGKTRFSLGVQDVFGDGGSAGESIPGDDRTSRSFFVAGTSEVAANTFVSAGVGTRRFSKGFVNASANLTDELKAMVEHDGFNFNYGLAYTRGYDSADEGRSVTMFLGYVRGRYLTWSVGASF